ncbi:MAG: hypothetical protein Q4P24_01860 [Rhodobacterales bacterium]|nr:hypothetical protein [Rhodobacterales bacterium]
MSELPRGTLQFPHQFGGDAFAAERLGLRLFDGRLKLPDTVWYEPVLHRYRRVYLINLLRAEKPQSWIKDQQIGRLRDRIRALAQYGCAVPADKIPAAPAMQAEQWVQFAGIARNIQRPAQMTFLEGGFGLDQIGGFGNPIGRREKMNAVAGKMNIILGDKAPIRSRLQKLVPGAAMAEEAANFGRAEVNVQPPALTNGIKIRIGHRAPAHRSDPYDVQSQVTALLGKPRVSIWLTIQVNIEYGDHLRFHPLKNVFAQHRNRHHKILHYRAVANHPMRTLQGGPRSSQLAGAPK